MAVIKKANVGVSIIAVNRYFDPQQGPRTEIIYQGLEDPIAVWAAQQAAVGGKAIVTQYQGPVYRATITFGDPQDGGNETPVDQWERVTEYYQADIRFNPLLVAAAGTIENLSFWIEDVKTAINDGTGYDGAGASAGSAKAALFDLLALGATAYELKRFVLRRRRTISLSFADVAVANAVETIYTTAKLVSVFGVPSSVANKLPAIPASTIAGFTWSWKERQDSSQYTPFYNRSEEIKDWVFAQWSTNLYTLIS